MSELKKIYIKKHKVKIAGKEYHLSYDLGTYAKLEDKGYSYTEICNMATSIKFKTLPVLLEAGIDEEEHPTVEELNKLLTLPDIAALVPILTSAVLNTAPTEDDIIQPEDTESGKKQKPKEPEV